MGMGCEFNCNIKKMMYYNHAYMYHVCYDHNDFGLHMLGLLPTVMASGQDQRAFLDIPFKNICCFC